MTNVVSPSETKTLTRGQSAKFVDLAITRLGKSGLPVKQSQEVLEQEAVELANEFVASVSRQIEARLNPSPCRLPFNGAVVEVHRGSNIFKLERRADGVYLDGKKLGLFRSENQKNGKTVSGHNLRVEFEKRGNNVNAKVLDDFIKHPDLWPDEWKKDAKGNTIYVFFWDDIFRNPARDDLYVRYGYWHDGEVVSSYSWLDFDWRGRDPVASFAS